jgi:hypothetical protein
VESVMTEPKQKMRDVPPTAVRLPPDLRHALAREASINGRSLHGEIVWRLQQSLLSSADQTKKGFVLNEPAVEIYDQPRADTERRLVTVFRKLSPEKQLALLALLK